MILIAGPCVLEDESTTRQTLELILEGIRDKNVDFYFKASCIKDNRTRKGNYRGLGFERGMAIFENLKREYNVKITTDFHSSEQIDIWGRNVDIVQIPAFLSRQSSLLESAAKTGKIVHVKKAQFMSPNDITQPVGILEESGADKIFVTDRGTQFGYDDWIMDPRHVVSMRNQLSLDVKILADITHPNKYKSGELNYSYAESLGLAYLAVGADGVFIETHPDCENALCDSNTMVPGEKFGSMINHLYQQYRFRKALDVV